MQFEVKRISRARQMCMGAAMLMVVFFHSGIGLQSEFGKFMKEMGDIGVDIFFIMSGLGIYYSLYQNGDALQFLKKRVIRILPAYLIVDGLWFAVFNFVPRSGGGMIGFLYELSTLSFWSSGRLRAWYIAGILLCYLISPFLLECEKRKHGFLLSLGLAVYAVGIIIRLTELTNSLGHLLVFLLRFPAYLFGLKLGEYCIQGRTVKVDYRMFILPALALVVCYICLGHTTLYFPWAFKYIAYFPISVAVILAVTYLPDGRVLRMFGKYSLEIYLLHEKVLWVVSRILQKLNFNLMWDSYHLLENLFVVLITLVGAIVLNRICSQIQKKSMEITYGKNIFICPWRKRKSRL